MRRTIRLARAICTLALWLAPVLSLSGCGRPSPARPSLAIEQSTALVAPAPGNSAAVTTTWRCLTARTGVFAATDGCGRVPMVVSAARVAAAAVPAAPLSLTATVAGGTVTLTWLVPTSTDPATSYVVEAGSSSGLANLAAFDTLGTATTFTATEVPAGTYFVRVRARNSAGTGAASNEVAVTVVGGSCTAAPGAPSGLTSSVISTILGASVSLSWSAPAFGCAPVTYVVEAGSLSGARDLAAVNTGSADTTFSAGGVANGTYYVRVRGVNAVSAGPASNEVTLTIPTAAGTYVLETIDGSRLPALTIPNPPNPCPGYTDSARLTLNANLTYRLSSKERIVCLSPPNILFDTVETGQWSPEGSTVSFATNAPGFNLRPAAVDATTLTVRFDAPHQNAGVAAYTVTGVWRKE